MPSVSEPVSNDHLVILILPDGSRREVRPPYAGIFELRHTTKRWVVGYEVDGCRYYIARPPQRFPYWPEAEGPALMIDLAEMGPPAN